MCFLPWQFRCYIITLHHDSLFHSGRNSNQTWERIRDVMREYIYNVSYATKTAKKWIWKTQIAGKIKVENAHVRIAAGELELRNSSLQFWPVVMVKQFFHCVLIRTDMRQKFTQKLEVFYLSCVVMFRFLDCQFHRWIFSVHSLCELDISDHFCLVWTEACAWRMARECELALWMVSHFLNHVSLFALQFAREWDVCFQQTLSANFGSEAFI